MNRSVLCGASLLLLALSSAGWSQTLKTLSLPTRDLLCNSRDGMIYASLTGAAGIQGKSIAIIDPQKAEIIATLPIPGEPGKLALSENGRYLYVGLDDEGLIQQVDLNSRTNGLLFPLGKDHTDFLPYSVADIEAVPDAPLLVAVALKLKKTTGSGGIAVFDSGVPIPYYISGYGEYSVIKFGAAPSPFYAYAYATPNGSIATATLSQTGEGFDESDTMSVPNSGKTIFGSDFVVSQGKLYSSNGVVMDPGAKTLTGSYSVTASNANKVAADPATDRILFYSAPKTGAPQIIAFDMANYAQIGSYPLTKIKGTVKRLVRWGANGLAFDSDDTVYLLATDLIPSAGSSADLSVTQTASPNPVVVGGTVEYRIVVTNAGPVAATGVTLKEALAPEMSSIQARTTQGQVTVKDQTVNGVLGTLAAGAQAVVTVTARPTFGGLFRSQASVSSLLSDPKEGDNSSVLSVNADLNLGMNRSGEISLPTNDLAYDPHSRKLYASVPTQLDGSGDAIAIIDPFAGTVTARIPIGSKPDKIALSDGGQFLYAALDGERSIRRLNLSTLATDQTFAVPTIPPIYFDTAVEDMAVFPGQPKAIAVSLLDTQNSYSFVGFILYDDGAEYKQDFNVDIRLDRIEFGDAPNQLFALNSWTSGKQIIRLNVNSIASIIDTSKSDIMGYGPRDFKYEKGRLYSSRGYVADAATLEDLGVCPGLSAESSNQASVEPDSRAHKVFYQSPTSQGWQIQSCDSDSFQAGKTLTFIQPGFDQSALNGLNPYGDLVRWGIDGLAFRTPGAIYLTRASLRLPPGAGDINGDGKVSIQDAQIALRAVVGTIQLTSEQLAKADIDGDGLAEISDVSYILSMALGL